MQLGKLAKFTILEKYPPGMEIRHIAPIVGRTCAVGLGA
jgi:hypothetical protein